MCMILGDQSLLYRFTSSTWIWDIMCLFLYRGNKWSYVNQVKYVRKKKTLNTPNFSICMGGNVFSSNLVHLWGRKATQRYDSSPPTSAAANSVFGLCRALMEAGDVFFLFVSYFKSQLSGTWVVLLLFNWLMQLHNVFLLKSCSCLLPSFLLWELFFVIVVFNFTPVHMRFLFVLFIIIFVLLRNAKADQKENKVNNLHSISGK